MPPVTLAVPGAPHRLAIQPNRHQPAESSPCTSSAAGSLSGLLIGQLPTVASNESASVTTRQIVAFDGGRADRTGPPALGGTSLTHAAIAISFIRDDRCRGRRQYGRDRMIAALTGPAMLSCTL